MRQLYVRTFTVVIFALLVSFNSGASPNPSQWRQLTLLGANNDFYYLLATERSWPGSYYSFTENWYLEKWRIGDNRRMEQTLLRTAYFINPSNEPLSQWQIKGAETKTSFDISQLLQEERLMAPYPGGGLPSKLKLKYHENQRLSLVYNRLDAPISGPVELFPNDYVEPRIYKMYQAHGYTFVHVESGYPDDVGYKQVMIPISEARRNTIIKLYHMHLDTERQDRQSQ